MAELIAEIGKRHSQLGRLRLVVTRVGENNLMTLKAECGSPSHPLRDQVAARAANGRKTRRQCELLDTGARPVDGKMIASANSYARAFVCRCTRRLLRSIFTLYVYDAASFVAF